MSCRVVVVIVGVMLTVSGCSQPVATTEPVSNGGSYPSDVTLGCPQIVREITHENMVIKQANAAAASPSSTGVLNQAGNGSPVLETEGAAADFAPTSSGETPEQLAADQTGTGAVARAKALVVLGKQKKCFL